MAVHEGADFLHTPIEEVKGVGARSAPAFRRLGLPNVGYLIHHLPARHEFEQAESTIAEIKPGVVCSARGEITATRVAGRPRGRKRFEAVLMDDAGGRLDLVFFNQAYLHSRIHPGDRVRVQGKASVFGSGLRMSNPAWETLPAEGEEAPAHAESRLRPVYPASEELPSRKIEGAIAEALEKALPLIEDHLPEELRRERELPTLAEAYRMQHAPRSEQEVGEGRRRIAYDELLLLQLGVHMKRARLRATRRAPALRHDARVDERIRARIPFELTPGQNGAIKEIVADLTRSTPANRLIQGDVGSGKTVVALYAMLLAVASEQQAAIMAPTELLAEQHYATLTDLLAGSDVRVELLTGSLTQAARESAQSRLESGEIDLIVGTHALLTERVAFKSLAVAVIDEQHRFGVHQRATLRAKSSDPTSAPHVLVMTATPIPRTLTLTIFGDLDVSTIRGLPPGRMPVTTKHVGFEQTDEVYDYVRTRIDRGEQAYVVVPAIDDGGALRDVRSTVKRLQEGQFAGKRVAALHGRMKRGTREQVMGRFRAGLIDALVSTTVIEVGVDVPNASIMIVEHAERFGLAQLHQLRGRVGRGAARSLCVLIAAPETEDSRRRLEAMVSTSDGFALAEKDLEIRGPGELLGAKQSGLPPLRVADLMRDQELLQLARRDAAAWIAQSPDLDRPGEALLRSRLMKTYGATMGLADLA